MKKTLFLFFLFTGLIAQKYVSDNILIQAMPDVSVE